MNTLTDDTSFEGAGWTSYGVEYDPGADGRITWAINGSQTWELTAAAMGPEPLAGIGQRLVSEEPMVSFSALSAEGRPLTSPSLRPHPLASFPPLSIHSVTSTST